jgi:hypothetical protein
MYKLTIALFASCDFVLQYVPNSVSLALFPCVSHCSNVSVVSRGDGFLSWTPSRPQRRHPALKTSEEACGIDFPKQKLLKKNPLKATPRPVERLVESSISRTGVAPATISIPKALARTVVTPASFPFSLIHHVMRQTDCHRNPVLNSHPQAPSRRGRNRRCYSRQNAPILFLNALSPQTPLPPLAPPLR